MIRTACLAFVCAGLLAVGAGCKDKKEAPQPKAAQPRAQQQGKRPPGELTRRVNAMGQQLQNANAIQDKRMKNLGK
jgi:hypothetical protein